MTWHTKYTPSEDAEINRLRLSGLDWAAIAVRMGRTKEQRSCVRQRAITARLPCVQKGTASAAVRIRSPRDDAGPDPLPPMHPLAWAVLISNSAPDIHSCPQAGRM